MTSLSHRSFVSYIDKSREYYAAQGYSEPYRWAVADDVAFVRPEVPSDQARVGVVTTSHFPPESAPPGVEPIVASQPMWTKRPYAAPIATAADATFNADLFWARDETHTDDPDSYLPVTRLAELASEGRIGSLSPRFYGVPTSYSQRRTVEQDAPEIEAWLREDQVDLVLLVGL